MALCTLQLMKVPSKQFFKNSGGEERPPKKVFGFFKRRKSNQFDN
jgi:hypothetical protein